MYDVLPGVDLFRRPADATFVIGLMIAVNTGYLVHRLLTGTASRWHFPAIEIALVVVLAAAATAIAFAAGELRDAAIPIATGIVFAAAGIALIAATFRLAPAHSMLAAVLLLAFTTGDLAWNKAPDESTGLPPSRYDALRPQTRDATVALLEKKLAETTAPDRRDRVELIAIAYHWPNLGLARGFDHLFGQNPLRLADFAHTTGVKDTVAEPAQRPFTPLYPSYRSAMADLFGVRFILTGVPVERIDPTLHPGDLEQIAHTADAFIYENPRALPRVMFLHDYRVVDFEELIRSGWPAGDRPRAHPPPRPRTAAPAGGTCRRRHGAHRGLQEHRGDGGRRIRHRGLPVAHRRLAPVVARRGRRRAGADPQSRRAVPRRRGRVRQAPHSFHVSPLPRGLGGAARKARGLLVRRDVTPQSEILRLDRLLPTG